MPAASECGADVGLPLPAVATDRGARTLAALISRLLLPLADAACPHRAGHKAPRAAADAAADAARAAPSAPAAPAGPAREAAAPVPAAAARVPHLSEAIVGCERLRVRDGVLSELQLRSLLDSVQSSPYFGENAGENDFYRGTHGFHVKFRDTHRTQVEEHLPFLKPALEALLRPECNCFFLNVFFARPDGQGYHTDNFFTSYCGGFRPTDVVTVAYLGASEAMVGGELVVLAATQDEVQVPPLRGEEEASARVLARVRPRAGRAVDFDGRLLHAVCPFTAPEPRISMVVEQCRLPRRHFLKTPKFNIYCQRTNKEVVLA